MLHVRATRGLYGRRFFGRGKKSWFPSGCGSKALCSVFPFLLRLAWFRGGFCSGLLVSVDFSPLRNFSSPPPTVPKLHSSGEISPICGDFSPLFLVWRPSSFGLFSYPLRFSGFGVLVFLRCGFFFFGLVSLGLRAVLVSAWLVPCCFSSFAVCGALSPLFATFCPTY